MVTPVFDPPAAALRAAIASVREQSFRRWSLVLVDDGSTDPEVARVLTEAAQDPRVTVVRQPGNTGIALASQAGLEAATGEFVALLDHDDLLAPNALERVALVIAEHPDVDYVYTDEDKVDERGRNYDRFAKPDWSPERLRSQMYTGHLSVLRTSLARDVGGFRAGFDGSQDHDLVLRVTERARRIVHVPEILYHWRATPSSTAASHTAKPHTAEAGRRAVEEHVHRIGLDATVELGPLPNSYRLRRNLPAERRISLIIPTRGSRGLVDGRERVFVVEAVRSALARTRHEHLEVVLVVDTDAPASVVDEVRAVAGERLVVVDYDPPFNYSRKNNLGVAASSGDVVVFLNDDTEALSDGWLEALVAPLAEHDVGMTGAKLFFADGTVQHGGHLYRDRGFDHAFLGAPADSGEFFGALQLDREAVGVTAACAAMRREVFDAVGRFDEALPVNFNDVDLCFRVLGAGYRIVFVAQAELTHFESKSRSKGVLRSEYDTVAARYDLPLIDPYLPTRWFGPLHVRMLRKAKHTAARPVHVARNAYRNYRGARRR